LPEINFPEQGTKKRERSTRVENPLSGFHPLFVSGFNPVCGDLEIGFENPI